MDRQPIGIVATSLVAATLVALAVVPEKERILICGIIYPERMVQSNDEYAFGISFVATRGLEDLEIRVRTIRGIAPASLGLESADRKDLENLPPLDLLSRLSSRLGVRVEATKCDVSFQEGLRDLLYYDFLPVLERLSPNLSGSRLRQVTASYAFLCDGDEVEACFRGGPEIFPDEMFSLSKMVLEMDGQPVYDWVRAGNVEREIGSIRIGAMGKGSRVDLIYNVDGRRADGRPLLWKIEVATAGQTLYSTARLVNAAMSA